MTLHMDRAVSRAGSLVVVLVLHLIVFYLVLLKNNVTVIYQPSVMKVDFYPQERPKEELPPPPRIDQDATPIENDQVMLPPIDVDVAPSLPVVQPDYRIDSIVTTSPVISAIRAESGFTTKPQPISKPHGMESYPVESWKARESGKTMIEICISETGSIQSIKVAKSSGYPRLDQAAIKIGNDYRFKPALLHGKPVAVCMNYGIGFSLNGVHMMSPLQPPPQQELTTQAVPDVIEGSPDTAPRNPDIGPVTRPVGIRTYLETLKNAGVTCTPMQLRTIGQDIHDRRYVIEAQCAEQPKGLVAYIPLGDAQGKFEIMDCAAASQRRIQCDYATR